MAAPQENIEANYNVFVRIIEGKEVNRVPLEEACTGMSDANADQLRNMYNVVLENQGKVFLLIPTAEVKSPEEQHLAQLKRQREQLDRQIEARQVSIKQQREQEKEQALRQQNVDAARDKREDIKQRKTESDKRRNNQRQLASTVFKTKK